MIIPGIPLPISLISTTFSKNDIGEPVRTDTGSSIVMCMPHSISRSEFSAAGQLGLSPDVMVTVYCLEYSNEQSVLLDGIRYTVYRTHPLENGDVELYLQREAGNG